MQTVSLIALLSLAAAAHAGDDDVLSDPQLLDAASPAWILTAGAEVDRDGGYLADGSVAFVPRENTTFTLHAGYADTSTAADQLTAGTVSLDFDQGFEHWGLSLSAGYWKDPDLVEATDLGGSLFAKWGGLRLTATVDTRSSNFDSFTVSGSISRPNQPPLAVSGDASCDLDGLALGGRLAFTGERWSAYAAGKSYDYNDFNCRFSSLTVGGIHVRPDRLQALNPAFLRLITLRATAAGFFNLRENTVFLDSSLAAGVSTIRGTHTFALDYLHTQELIDGLAADTLTASVSFALSRRTDLELHVGAFDAEGMHTVGFAGVTLIAYLGGG
ncbi:MAG: hypothetical protein ACRET4_08185 [Steroidobacteraceae bacterium]